MSIFYMIHGYLIPYFPSSSVLIVLMCGSVKKDGKGVDILASLCNKYETSEDELRKTMEKANNLIADIFYKSHNQHLSVELETWRISTQVQLYIYIYI